jgi:hypothetical protein
MEGLRMFSLNFYVVNRPKLCIKYCIACIQRGPPKIHNPAIWRNIPLRGHSGVLFRVIGYIYFGPAIFLDYVERNSHVTLKASTHFHEVLRYRRFITYVRATGLLLNIGSAVEHRLLFTSAAHDNGCLSVDEALEQGKRVIF